MDKQSEKEKQLLNKRASHDADTHIRSSSKSLAGQQIALTQPAASSNNVPGIFHIAPLESKLMTVNDLPQIAKQKKSTKSVKPFHFRTLSPRGGKAKTSYEKITKKSGAMRTEDVENVLKEKVTKHRNPTVNVPKISSAYQKTTYKFRAKEQPLPPERNRTPTENQIRTAIRSQLPVFGYNCEKRNTATLSHWNTSSPPAQQSKQRAGSKPTYISQHKSSQKALLSEQNDSPRMRHPIALDVRGLADHKEFKIVSPRKGSVHSSMDTAAMRESLTDIDTFRGFMDPVLRTLAKGRKSPSSMQKSERQISRDNLALLHEVKRDEDIAAYYSYVDSYASNNIINEMIMEGYSIEETEGSKPTTSQRRTAYSRYNQLRERIQAQKEMQAVKVRTFQMKNNSKTNSESSLDQSAPFKSPRVVNVPPLSSPHLPTRGVGKAGADAHHSLLKMLNQFRKRGGVAPKNIQNVQKLKTAILIQPYAQYFSEPSKPSPLDEKLLAFKRNSRKVNIIPDQNYSPFTDKHNQSVSQHPGYATTNLAKVVQLNQQALLTERSESLTLTSELPGRRHMKELLLRTPGESETHKAITKSMLPRTVLRQGKKQADVLNSSRRQSVLPMLFPIPVNATILSNQESALIGSTGMTPEPKDKGRMTVPHELVSRYDPSSGLNTLRNNESVEEESKEITRIRETEVEGTTTQDQISTVQQGEKQGDLKSKQASQAEIQTVEQAAGSVIESIPTIMEVTMTREMESKTSFPSKFATELTLQNVTPFSRATINQEGNPATPNRRYQGALEVVGGHALSTVTSIYQDSPGRDYIPPGTTSSMPPPRKTVAYTYSQNRAKKQITNSFFETQQHAEMYLEQTMHSDGKHSREERKRPLNSKRKKITGVSANTTPFEPLESSHDNASSDFITLVGSSKRNKLRGVNTGQGKGFKQERLLRSGEWESRSPEPQPFSNERIKHATTQTSRGNLLEMSKNNRGEIMQLIQRRTFFKSSRKLAMIERNKEERKRKMIFGFSCKDDKEFRQKYFHKSLLVPESLNVLREEENSRKNSNKSERVVLPRIRQKVI